ncbi:MAG: ester cyclase [Chitinophagaceae bacterium]|nr:ester cyclase [Chitinophagaceae bacterium]MCW5929710.1 ester cyclase [Chitinophagaceae bacterium]
MKQILLIATSIILLSSCSIKNPNTENVALVKRFVNEVINDGNIDLIDSIWAENMQWHCAGLPDTKGRQAYKLQMEAAVNGAFENMHLDIIDVVADNDKVVLYFTNSGKNVREFLGHHPTGKFAKWQGVGIYRIENGQIAEAWFIEDFIGMYNQLGFLNN